MNPRIEALEKILATRPDDLRAHFGLAVEYERMEMWEKTAKHLQSYLARSDDEGNAFGRLARALRRLGRESEARDAYEAGIQAAYRHNHPSLASELEEEREET